MFSHYTYVDYKPGAQWTMYILRYNVQQPLLILDSDFVCVAVCCRALQCVAVCYSVLQGVAGRCRVLQGVAGCCSVLQRVVQGVARSQSTTYTYNTQGPYSSRVFTYTLLQLECHSISISILNLIGLFLTERGNRDLNN